MISQIQVKFHCRIFQMNIIQLYYILKISLPYLKKILRCSLDNGSVEVFLIVSMKYEPNREYLETRPCRLVKHGKDWYFYSLGVFSVPAEESEIFW